MRQWTGPNYQYGKGTPAGTPPDLSNLASLTNSKLDFAYERKETKVESFGCAGSENEAIHGDREWSYYYAFAPYAGQGLMHQGMRLVLKHAFGKLKLHRHEANIQPTNRVFLALVQKCGFNREGLSPRFLKVRDRWKDHERWALLSEDFR
jgi:RimJ/RimL family protein N-acetyltransferase